MLCLGITFTIRMSTAGLKYLHISRICRKILKLSLKKLITIFRAALLGEIWWFLSSLHNCSIFFSRVKSFSIAFLDAFRTWTLIRAIHIYASDLNTFLYHCDFIKNILQEIIIEYFSMQLTTLTDSWFLHEVLAGNLQKRIDSFLIWAGLLQSHYYYSQQ